MNPELLEILTAVGVETWRGLRRSARADRHDWGGVGEPILDAIAYGLDINPQTPLLDRAAELVAQDPTFEAFGLAVDGNRTLFHLGDVGFLITSDSLAAGLVEGSLRALLFAPDSSYAVNELAIREEILRSYEKVRAVAAGEDFNDLVIYGLRGVDVQAGQSVRTPWGIVRHVPDAARRFGASFNQSSSNAVLIRHRLSRAIVVSEPIVEAINELDTIDDDQERLSLLLPLAFALCQNPENLDSPPSALALTFTMGIRPFSAGFTVAHPNRHRRYSDPMVLTDPITESVERWLRLVDERHPDSFNLPARRLVSAVAERVDPTDALIDALVVWESLFGPEEPQEVTFRVTAALAKLLEADPANRLAIRKELGRVYDTRSRVVHGGSVDPSRLAVDSDLAIKYAAAAMRALYERGGDWLTMKSRARSDRLLLLEP